MSKMLRPQTARPPINYRELFLLAAVVAAGVGWYFEREQTNDLSRQLSEARQEQAIYHGRFDSMLQAEESLRRDPSQKEARLIITEFGKTPTDPRLRWTLDLHVLDDKELALPEGGSPAAEKAAASASVKLATPAQGPAPPPAAAAGESKTAPQTPAAEKPAADKPAAEPADASK
ncbi:MAG TPA: hypothetical protein VMF30_14235 [Pirellulales bacterium]|nr:hypothetical protein [Pirellulales bacterium]